MKLNPRFTAPFLHFLYRLWCSTLRITESGRDQVNTMQDSGTIMVFPLWHDELFPLLPIRGNLRMITIVSQSRDGDYVASLQEGLGIKAIRGSSSKGGVKALLKAASLMRQERYHCGITVDGPRGPRHVAKPGAVILAVRSKATIVPVRVFMNKAKRFHSWDRFQLPLPWSSVHILWGEPYTLEDSNLSAAFIQQECRALEQKLNLMDELCPFS